MSRIILLSCVLSSCAIGTAGPPPPSAPPEVAAAGGIAVVAATYGRVCNVAPGNATAFVARDCGGKASCDFLVNNRDGDPKFGCCKDFDVTWRCSGDARERHAEHARVCSEGYKVQLSCP
jgi:hypothetical protein